VQRCDGSSLNSLIQVRCSIIVFAQFGFPLDKFFIGEKRKIRVGNFFEIFSRKIFQMNFFSGETAKKMGRDKKNFLRTIQTETPRNIPQMTCRAFLITRNVPHEN
jgi:hypothetical protein